MSAYPSVVWSPRSDFDFTGCGSVLDLGRLDFSLSHGHGLTKVLVFGSHNSDQRQFVKELARCLEAVAFDSQTGQVLE